MRARSTAALALLVSAGVGPGCECVAGLDDDVRLGGGGGGPASSSSGAGGGGSASIASTAAGGGEGGAGGGAIDCTAMDVPPYPGGDDPGGDLEVVAALRTIELNDGDRPLEGLNLDGACTCPDASSCIPGDGSREELLCDAERGIDAQTGRLFAQLALLSNDQFSSAALSEELEVGGWGLLVRVQGWTGEPTDARVRFSVFTSGGLPDESPPTWSGEDAWAVDSTSVGPAGTIDDPLFVDDNAYVAGGVLVASLPQTGLSLVTTAGTRLDLPLVAGFVRARLVASGDRHVVEDGVLAARIRTEDFFDALDGYRDGNGDPLCSDSQFFDIARDTICEAADIYSGTSTPTAPCDALSVGVGFTADPARLGPVQDGTDEDPGCEPGTEPSLCTCDGGC